MARSGYDDGYSIGFGGPTESAAAGRAAGMNDYAAAAIGAARAAYDRARTTTVGVHQSRIFTDALAGGSYMARDRMRASIIGRAAHGMDGLYAEVLGGQTPATLIVSHVAGTLAAANLDAAEVRVYGARDDPPDVESMLESPLATIRATDSLPYPISFTSLLPGGDGTHTYWFDFRRFNAYGKYTGAARLVRARVRKLSGVVTALTPLPSKPYSVTLGLFGDHQIQVTANYNQEQDTYATRADSWYVWWFTWPYVSVAPPPDYSEPMGFADGAAKLSYLIPENFTPSGAPSGVDVVVATHRAADDSWSGADDWTQGTVITHCQPSATEPTPVAPATISPESGVQ